MPQPDPVPPRETTIFRNNRSLAVRIPPGFGAPGDKVRVITEGDRLIIEPVGRSAGLVGLLAQWALEPPLGPEDDFPDIDEGLLPLKDVDL
ncbi:antitoxin [Enterovirga rhinocerotis]|uniref:Antitoxin VapB n=1 Tax=Enterovirga rhinocerotis TaxID=1339210 RepID=A0A4R7BVM9_9HYPH|nr:antitoxin [Enterovirga rhinocerotis]TDR89894.1 antitoxin VapB [Enterovirga rhinocerotis]